MRGKKCFGIALCLSAILFVSGCGSSFPEMTEDQYKQTVEYAAGLLMRYSNNGQERLIYVDAQELEKQRRKEAEKAAKEEAAKPAPATKPAQQSIPHPAETTPVSEEPQETAIPQGALAEATAETPESTAAASEVTEAEAEASSETAIKDPSAIVLSNDETQEIENDIFLSYQGYMVTSTYPESSKSYVVNADKGKKLLVLRFDLYNASDSAKTVNMISKNMLFEILLNGQNIGYSSVTFLPNDLSSFSGTIDSRAHESVVVLTQINEKQSGHIDSLGMIVTMNGQSQTVILQ